MRISRIEIRNFRSFRQFGLDLDGESMFVTGGARRLSGSLVA
jgi:predicted ATP-dependent endonuclease of OLD family